MLKLRETPEPTLREVHICTVCCQEMKPTDETTTMYDVTHHTRCAHVVRAAEKEAAQDRQTTDNHPPPMLFTPHTHTCQYRGERRSTIHMNTKTSVQMTLLHILIGPRASGKTTAARHIAGDEAFTSSGIGLAENTNWLRQAPAGCNWIIDGGGMNVMDMDRLAGFVSSGFYPIERNGGAVEQREMPRVVVVDGYQW